jgi:hypothetical protein
MVLEQIVASGAQDEQDGAPGGLRQVVDKVEERLLSPVDIVE